MKNGNMKKKTAYLIAVALISFSIVGCVSTDTYYRDVTLSREKAYQIWQGREKSKKQAQPVIEGQLALQDCLKLAVGNNKTLQIIVEGYSFLNPQNHSLNTRFKLKYKTSV